MKAGVIFKTLSNLQDQCADQSELTLVLAPEPGAGEALLARWPVLELLDLGEVSKVEEAWVSGVPGTLEVSENGYLSICMEVVNILTSVVNTHLHKDLMKR